jgi:uncharacterized integral membrane protein
MLILVLFTIFVANNTEAIDIWFFFWPLNISKIVLLVIILVIGVIIGLITATTLNKSKEKDKLKIEKDKSKTEKVSPGSPKKIE